MSASIANPQNSPGFINRARANVQVPMFPNLNITVPFLGKGGILWSRSGSVTTMIDNMTTRTPSPDIYQPVTISIHIAKSMPLAAAWEAQIQSLSTIGNILLFPSVTTLPVYSFQGCAIENVGPLDESGTSNDYMLSLTGTYIINNQLFALTI
jgi:hypothetical protein